MDKKTFEALNVIMAFAKRHGADGDNFDAFMQVHDWMREVEKDYVGPDATE